MQFLGSRLIVEAGCEYAGRSNAVHTISASYGGAHACSRSLVSVPAVGRQHQLEDRYLTRAFVLKICKGL